MLLILLYYLTDHGFALHIHLIIQVNLASVLPRTTHHPSTTDPRLYSAPGRASARSELLHGQQITKRKTAIKVHGPPASIPAAHLQNTKHKDHAIFGNMGLIHS
jgi:hypothetical protein